MKDYHYTARRHDDDRIGVRMPGCEYMLTQEEASKLRDALGLLLHDNTAKLRATLETIRDRCLSLEKFAGGVGSHDWLQETVVTVGRAAQAALSLDAAQEGEAK
jgi:hypothetical protein